MEWIKSLDQAINYMEDHLFDELTNREIADHLYISSYHFQRAFSLLTGMTVGEYIRNRRLSLAGQELILSDVKIIDIALKYGYETPESFTKAFIRFHGVTPSKAKIAGSDLKSFNRLLIKIRLEGGNIMDYKMVRKEAFTVCAKTKIFTAENREKGIPEFWSEYFASGSHKQVSGELGICEQEKTGTGEFRYGIGCTNDTYGDIPADFEWLKIPAYTWAVLNAWVPCRRLFKICGLEYTANGCHRRNTNLFRIMIWSFIQQVIIRVQII